MKKYIALLLLLFVYKSAYTQLKWKISQPGNADAPVSYIVGSHHLIDYGKADSLLALNDIIPNVSTVVGELELSDAKVAEMSVQMSKAAMVSSEESLSTLLTTVQLDSIQKILDTYAEGFDVKMFDRMYPAYISMIIEVSRAAKMYGTPALPMDKGIQDVARNAGKEVKALETVEDQCKALFGAPIIEQAGELLWSVNHDEEVVTLVHRLYDAYCHGDLNELLEVIEQEYAASPGPADALIAKRNTSWLHLLAGMLPAMSLLIVVGAGHLPGEKGLINGLRKLGFNVTPE